MQNKWALCLCVVCAACEAGEPAPVPSERTQTIVYGQDDRREVYESSDELREVARSAIVGLIPKGRIQRPAGGEIKVNAIPLSTAYDLCDGERFLDQPTAADCTGVLIDDDLVLTAGHCFEDLDCDGYFYVFDYFYGADKKLEAMSSADIYGCRKLAAQEMSERNGRQIDYAVVQLDRAVLGRRPLSVRPTPVQPAEPLVVLGMGSGLPIKVDQGARVVSARAVEHDFFMLEADTFQGSSGSAILDTNENLLGILVRGGNDYVEDPLRRCQLTNRLERAMEGNFPDGELAHEEATYASAAREGLCARGFPSLRLCDITPVCGDTFCTGQEDRESCAVDCDPCTSESCGARGSLRSERGDEVKQSPGSGRASDSASCSLAPHAQRQGLRGGWLAVLGCALFRRRWRRWLS